MTSLRMCLQDKEAREPKKNAICKKKLLGLKQRILVFALTRSRGNTVTLHARLVAIAAIQLCRELGAQDKKRTPFVKKKVTWS